MSAASFVSYAQHGEDVVLWRALGHRRDVFYVDVGAFDPTYDSVTCALYERGWRGVNLEPQPDRLEAFQAQRPEDINLAVAAGDADGTALLAVPANPGWATLLPEALPVGEATTVSKVPLRRLDRLLAELDVEHADVLTVDVQGSEASVVRGLLAGPLRPDVCVIAGVTSTGSRTAGDEAVALLVAAGYHHCMFDGLNHFLTLDQDLAPNLSIPANPTDGYTTDLVHRLQDERRSLHETVAALATENVALRSRLPVAAAITDDATTEAGNNDDSDLPLPSTRDLDRDVLKPGAEGLDDAGPDADVDRADSVDTGSFETPLVRASPHLREQRRRETFGKLISGPTAQVPPADQTGPLGHLLRLIDTELTPSDTVALLYREVLGREADLEGLSGWVRHVEAGESLLDVARALAASPEGAARPAEERARVNRALRAWQSMLAAREIGLAGAQFDHVLRVGAIGHQIYVEALFEVALQRLPRPEEVEHEIGKLRDGVGREWLLRAFAARPEARLRILGPTTPGLRGKVRRWRDNRHYLRSFRELVIASEGRQLSQLLAAVAAGAADSGPTTRTKGS